MTQMAGGDPCKCPGGDGDATGDTHPVPGRIVEGVHHHQTCLAQEAPLAGWMCQRTCIEVSSFNEEVLVERRQSFYLTACDAKYSVAKDAFSISEMSEHLAHAPLTGSVTQVLLFRRYRCN